MIGEASSLLAADRSNITMHLRAKFPVLFLLQDQFLACRAAKHQNSVTSSTTPLTLERKSPVRPSAPYELSAHEVSEILYKTSIPEN